MSARTTRPEIRRATADDFIRLLGAPPEWRVRAFAVEHDGKLLGVGGLAYLPDGTVAAFVQAAPGAHDYKVTFHRAGLMAMAEARRLGLRRVVAIAETSHPRAEHWLLRLGFKPNTVDGVTAWVWERGT